LAADPNDKLASTAAAAILNLPTSDLVIKFAPTQTQHCPGSGLTVILGEDKLGQIDLVLLTIDVSIPPQYIE
jgi:hypothetical protein